MADFHSNQPLVTSHPAAEDDSSWLRSALVMPWWGVIAITLVMLGKSIFYGTYYAMTHPEGQFYSHFADYYFLQNTILESSLLALLLIYLRSRGWKPADLRIQIGWMTSLSAVGLLLLTFFCTLILVLVLLTFSFLLKGTPSGHWINLFVPQPPAIPPGSLHLTWKFIIGFTILNAFFEEITYMGFAFNQWARKYGPKAAVIFTVVLRLSVHTYQGTEHLVQIGTWSLVFGLWYRFQGKLWPLILAHMMIDFISLGTLKALFGSH